MINIISWISVVSVAIVSFALVIVLSAFNGLEDLVESLYESFDPDVKITLKEGKTFDLSAIDKEQIVAVEEVEHYVETVEELGLLSYDQKQAPATIKGVESSFLEMTALDSTIIDGELKLKEGATNYAVVGYKISSNLSIFLGNVLEPITIYAPKRGKKISLNPERAFRKKRITPAGIFLISPEFDAKYVLVPIDFARELFDYKGKASSIELGLKEGCDSEAVRDNIQELVGEQFVVRTREQLNEILYKTNKTEKWVTFLILIFILVIASFNIIGSLTMLILDKKRDIGILKSMGASNRSIQSIFLIEGMLINLVGAFIGILLGVIICALQQYYGLIRLEGGIVDFYPILMQFQDLISILAAVLFIGFVASYFPVKVFTKRYF